MVILDGNFECVLLPVMEKQWIEKKNALLSLKYFEFFTTDQIISACKLCVLKQFEPLEAIYYKNPLRYVYFIISGECMMLQCIEMMVSKMCEENEFNLAEIAKKKDSGHPQKLSEPKVLNILSNGIKSQRATHNATSEDIANGNEISNSCDHVREELKNCFIDVGSVVFGGIVGLEDNIEHLVIIARTVVQCLMVPRFWLFEKDQNPDNIWQRRAFYLKSSTPSYNMLFTEVARTRQWQKYKKRTLREHLDTELISNPTRLEDIPIICRIVEVGDY